MQVRILHGLFALCLSLAACGGSSGGSDGTGSGNGDTAGSNGNDPGALLDSGLAHDSTPVPTRVVNPDTEELFSDIGRQQAEAMPEALGVVYEVVENQGGDTGENCASLGAQFGSCSVVNLHLKDADGLLEDGNWRLYFHSIRRLLRVDSDVFTAHHINGDLHALEPTEAFDGFGGGVRTVKFFTEFSHLVESDFMPRYWLVRDGDAPRLIENTDEETDESRYSVEITGENAQAFAGEAHVIATPASRFDAHANLSSRSAAITATEVQNRIIPRPRTLEIGTDRLDITAGLSLDGLGLSAGASAALASRQQTFLPLGGAVPVDAEIDTSLPAEGYALDIDPTGIRVRAADQAGLFHAGQSVLALVQPGVTSLPAVSIVDSPRFAYRGLHVDLARNVHSRESLERLMDQMAAYKLNRLHLHLSDDEGWRLEIPSLPELTTVGAQREFNLTTTGLVDESRALMPQLGSGPASDNQGSGFLERSDFIALLRYAADRQIAVIPSFDMPGHARAAIIAMRARAVSLGDPSARIDDPDDTSRYLSVQHFDDSILNPCVAGTLPFVETIVTEVKAMYDEANAPLEIWHMGGDEANSIFSSGFEDGNGVDLSDWDAPWSRSPACASLIAEDDTLSDTAELQDWFVRRVAEIVANAGVPALYAYSDIFSTLSADELATTRAGASFWDVISQVGVGGADALLERGFETVIAVPDFLYFDFPQEVSPRERGFYWATRFTDLEKVFSFTPANLAQNAGLSVNREGNAWEASAGGAATPFTGLQAHLWSETIRTPEQLEYMAFPRLLALAERAWHQASWELEPIAGQRFTANSELIDYEALEQDYTEFVNALGKKELVKLDAAGIRYRVPVPGARRETAALSMNSAIPGLSLQFATDDGDWQSWQAQPESLGATRVRALSTDGSRASREDRLE